MFSELYTYNNLNELTSFERGTLTSPLDAISGTPTASQSWDLDALGNFTSVTTNGTTVDNTANQQNEYTALGSATPTYDANGNMTTDETGQQYVYDAWNRLVAVKDSSGDVEASYSYDGLGRRVTETHGDTTTDLYFSAAGQVLEEQVGGVTQARNVWSPVYVNALVLRDQSSEGDGDLDQRLYVMQDANWNVTGLVDTTGAVVERYVYSPYGVATVLAPDWSARGSSDYRWLYLFQGGRYDAATGDYIFNARDYRPTTGQWLERDPLGEEAGDVNIGRFVGNDPMNATDPTGLKVIVRMSPVQTSDSGKGGVTVGKHASVFIIVGDKVIKYDGSGLTSVDADGRPIPTRVVLDKLPDLGAEEVDYAVNTDWETAEQELKALEYAFDHIWQLPYESNGPNSNTYAHALLTISHMRLAPIPLEVAGAWGIDRSRSPRGSVVWTPAHTIYWDMPWDAIGWKASGYGPCMKGAPEPKGK